MPSSFESGALLGHVYTLRDGSCVRLRLARSSDFVAIRGLLAEVGSDAPDLEAASLVHFDPRRRYVICAAGLVDSTESLLGLGSIELDAAEPDRLVLADPRHEELRRRLETVLVDAARATSRAA
jgi:hypothetical protein